MDLKINNSPEEKKASAYFEHLISLRFGNSSVQKKEAGTIELIEFRQAEKIDRFKDLQYYKIEYLENENIILIQSAGQLGLIYGAVTLADLIFEDAGYLKFDKKVIEDWPSYTCRLFVADPNAEDIPSLFDWALQNKLETVVLASRRHPWYEVTAEYSDILNEIKKWRDKYGAPEVMQSHNIYEGRDIVISDESDVTALKKVIKTSYEHGINKLMILSDDTPPFKFGQGYILTDENDKKRFEHFEAANTYLMNDLVKWFKEQNMEIESFYVPAFYTYEENRQGDMALFIDTPWEKDAFDPLYRDLEYVGTHMDESVYLIWCGPNVRSRTITNEDFADWKSNLNDRAPFLWDNTIYSHYPFTSTSMLTAWNNELPENFHEITAGNGMFINNDANSETGIVGTITTNDYLWDPDTYVPERSLETAVIREYGADVKDLVLKFKDIELKIRRTIGERKLWFEADSLWKQIRKVRHITEKNPFYYHLNYTRMKALRLQLKASVPEPYEKSVFVQKVNDLYEERSSILFAIKEKNESSYNRLISLASPKAEFNLIK